MGFRIRKSFGGKMFRVNISKSGIGYSYGVPGLKKTKLANGRTRTTASILGTGISYVSESSNRKGNTSKNNDNQYTSYETDILNDIDNVDKSLFEASSHEEFINALKKAKTYYNCFLWLVVIGIFMLIGAEFILGPMLIIAGLCVGYYFNKYLKLNVEYNIEHGENTYKEFKEFWLKINNSKKIWEIVSDAKITNTKANAGAGRKVDRKETKFKEVKLPYLNIGDEKILKVKLRKKEVLFLKDKIVIFNGGKVAGVDYKDLKLEFSDQKFIEDATLPKDATIVDYTWQYVNKNGQPDKRYSNNRKLPICMYGKINISDFNNTFNIELQISNYEEYNEIANLARQAIKSVEDNKEK